jgi:hypothetical protein
VLIIDFRSIRVYRGEVICKMDKIRLEGLNTKGHVIVISEIDNPNLMET